MGGAKQSAFMVWMRGEGEVLRPFWCARLGGGVGATKGKRIQVRRGCGTVGLGAAGITEGNFLKENRKLTCDVFTPKQGFWDLWRDLDS